MQKGFAPLLILVTALVVIAAGATYYFGIKKPEDFRTKVSRQNPEFWPSLSPGPTNYPDYETKPIDTDETANWKTYTIIPDSSLGYGSYQIKLPIIWKQVEHSSNFQSTEKFQDGQHVYQLVIEEQKNYNSQTGQPFVNLKELAGLPYDVTTLIVDGQQAIRSLPRAGSEYIYKALFFSRDAKLVYNITLESPRDGSKIQEGEALFNQIISTFKFTE